MLFGHVMSLAPVRIETSPALVLAGRNGTFAIGPSPGIKELWEKFMGDFGKIAGQVGTKAYGVCHNFDGSTHMDYMAAAQVVNAGDVPGYMHTLIIPARKVAVFVHEGPVETLSQTWGLIFSEGIPDAHLTVAAGPQFEVYGADFNGSDGIVEIHIPVA